MKKASSNLFIFGALFSLIASCGKSSPGSSVKNVEEVEGSIDGSTIDGLYRATYITLNPHVNGTIPGSLTLYRQDDKLITYARLFAGGPRVWHQQGIYLGKRCPNLGDDKNADGYIDIVEAMAVVGKMIIPLDANMNSQSAGRSFFPLADLSGYYHYERVSSFRRLFDDLRSKDLDSEDHVAKLEPNEKFSWEKRVVMVQGVTEETIFPETVAGLERRKPFQTLPITCGIIQKVTTVPGVPDTGVIPGPISPVVDGQDQPAPPDEDETAAGTGGGTVSGTTGTNDNEDGEVGDEGGTAGGSSGRTTGGTTGRTSGGFIGGFIGGSSGGRTTASTSGGTTGGTAGGTTGRSSGGFIGGFIGGSAGGTTGGASGDSTGGTSGTNTTTGGTTGN